MRIILYSLEIIFLELIFERFGLRLSLYGFIFGSGYEFE